MARKFSVEAVLEAKDRASKTFGRTARAVNSLSRFFSQFVKVNLTALPVIGSMVAGLGRFRVALGVGLLAAVVAVIAGLAKLFSSLKEGVDAFAAQEVAVARLNAALRSTNDFSEEASRSLQAYANSLQVSTTATQTQVLELIALSKSFGATNEQAKALTAAALDFAEGADLNATEAVRRLGRALQGSAADVANFAPEIRNLSREQLRLGGATDAISRKFSGSAKASLDTYSGAVKNLENAQARLLESQGALIVGSDALRESIILQARLTDRLSVATENSVFSFQRLALGWQNAKLIGTGLNVTIKEMTNLWAQSLAAVFGFTKEVDTAASTAAKARAEFRKLIDENKALTKNFNTLTRALGSESEALDVLFRAYQRNIRITKDQTAANELLQLTLDRLGLRSLPEVQRALVETTASLRRVEAAYDDGKLGVETYRAAVEDLSLEQEALQAVLDGTAVSVDAYKRKILQARDAEEAARRSTELLSGSTDAFRLSQEAATAAVILGTEALGLQAEQQARSAILTSQQLLGGGSNQFGPGGLFPGLSGSTFVITTVTDEAGDFVSRDVRQGGLL